MQDIIIKNYSFSWRGGKADIVVVWGICSILYQHSHSQNKYGDNNVDDETLIKTLYHYRHNYVENLPEHSEPGDNRITRQEKLNILNNRYPNELKDALECLKNEWIIKVA